MQFSVVALVAALAATASATYPVNGTSTAAYYPTGTGTGAPTVPAPTSSFTQTPFEGAATKQGVAGSALAMVVAGGVALVSLHKAQMEI